MLVGNYFNHGLYHGLIPIMNVPFLNSEPAPLMYVSRVRDIMHNGTVHLPELCHIGELTMLMNRVKKKCCVAQCISSFRNREYRIVERLTVKKGSLYFDARLREPSEKGAKATGQIIIK